MNIEDLPDEVLEFILSLISPYQDLHDCMAVSKRWRKCVHNVVKIRRRNLNKSITDFNVKWINLTPPDGYPTISKRYSHSATIHDNSMYVFGGCTSYMTTFNDLWKLDLSTRTWLRPLATGSYPSPKACSSLIYYKNMLVLFGGWTYPPSYPLYQTWHLFDELHVYDIHKNHWKSVNTLNSPPPLAGHSVSVVDDWMVVFGGLAKTEHAIECQKTNDVWKLNLNDWTWIKQETEGQIKPEGRFGQTQVILDDKHLFIMGGSGGSNAIYGDAWILKITNTNLWKWIPVEIKGKANKPSNIWSNPGCKVDDKIIFLNRMYTDISFPINSSSSSSQYGGENPSTSSARIDLANRRPDLDENVNGRRGYLKESYDRIFLPRSIMHKFAEPTQDSRQGMTFLQRQKDKEMVNSMYRKKSPYFLGLYVLDLQHALENKPYVTWLSPKALNRGPEETILYTLVQGKSEVVMFGGIQNDTKSLGQINIPISNSLHFMSAKDHII